MQIHEVKPKTKLKTKKVVGRGGKRGKTAGRGTKGQKARAGHRIRPAIRDIIKKLPKKRGEGVSRNRFKTEASHLVIVKMSALNSAFESGDQVTPKILLEKEIIKRSGDRVPLVKILADGALDKKLEVYGCLVSEGAKAKIEKAGGRVVKSS
ncbi:MAG: uL15 family ribosomal protein [Candidatus Yonathbacteria bacterium]|nr:uL15 family ribosomal protein [Candidatus Yonathbacteria bacterium]